MIDFDIAPVKSSIIMCAGIGGGGGNAVRHMFKLGMADVTFVICNTDRQALEDSPVPIKIRLGDQLTGGLGAGNKPERGKQAAEESLEQIKEVFRENETRMLFVTAGMGGGTGTGAAPVIAKAAKEMGILTVAIVSIPFKTEGRKRVQQAIEGIEEISKYVDSLLVVDNESINEIYGDLTLSDAFGKADDILATAAKSIADIITSHFKINVDFEDVKTVMQNSGVALMGSAQGSGENRALEVATKAMSSPLLNHKDISGAQNVLLNITSGTREVTLRETYEITEYIQQRAGNNNATDLIWGAGQDEALGEEIRVTVIATGFGMESIPALRERYKSTLVSQVEEAEFTAAPSREIINLDDPEQPSKESIQPAASEFEVVFREQNQSGGIQNEGSFGGEYAQSLSRQVEEARAAAQSTNQQAQRTQSYGREEAQPNLARESDYRTPSSENREGQSPRKDQAPITIQLPPRHRVENVVEPRQQLVSHGDPLTQDLSDDDLNTPAWKRRGVLLDPIVNHGAKIQRETLQTDPNTAADADTKNLFGE